MPTPDINQLLAGAVRAPVQMAPMPTQAQRDEVEKVRHLQVRSQAAMCASNCLHGCDPSPQIFVALARVVELYIEGGAEGDMSPPV